MERTEIIKALECISRTEDVLCEGCAYRKYDGLACHRNGAKEALSLINELTEESETLNLRLQTPLSPNNDMYIKNLETQIKKLTDENEVLRAINTLLERDIADRDEMLKKKVEEVYPEFMRDYKCMEEELDGYSQEVTELTAKVKELTKEAVFSPMERANNTLAVRADTVREMQERVKRELLQYDDYDELYVKTVRDCMTHIAKELIGGEGEK